MRLIFIIPVLQSPAISFLTALILLIINLQGGNSEPSSSSWDFVRVIELPSYEVDSCQIYCDSDVKCQEWELRMSPNALYSNQSGNASTFMVDCYLQSREFLNIKSQLSNVDETNNTSSKIWGEKLYDDSVSLSFSKSLHQQNVQLQQLIPGLLAVDTTTLLNFPQHFVSQCAYTISLWVWIWKPQHVSPSNAQQKVVFTTKEVFPRLSTLPPLLPAIIYNVGVHPDRFFFSAAQGRQHNDYLGFHRGQVRYLQWTHLALTVQGNALRAYQDGEFLDSLQYSPAELQHVTKCAYETNMQVHTRKARSPAPGSAALNRSVKGDTRPARSTGALFYDRIVTDPFATEPNNTVMYVAGKSGSLGEHSMTGMLHKLAVVRNRALSDAQIQRLYTHTQPPRSEALEELLRKYGVSSRTPAQCFLEVAGDFYRALEWRLCPDSVCGPQCIDETVYSCTNRNAARDSVEPLQQVTTEEIIRPVASHNLEGDVSNVVRLSRPADPRHGAQELPDIGYPLGAVEAELVEEDVFAWVDDGAGLDKLLRGPYWYSRLAASLLTPFSAVLWLVDDLAHLALELLFGIHFVDMETLGVNATSRSVPPDDVGGGDVHAANFLRWRRMHRNSSQRWYSGIREGQVQGLYKNAMVWSTDRYLRSSSAAPNNSTTAAGLEMDFMAWRRANAEQSRAALMLGMWIADDVTAGKTDDRDYPWNFRYSPLLAQPIHLALGFRSAFGEITDNFVPASEVEALVLASDHPGAVLTSLLKNPADSAALLEVHSVVETEPLREFYIDESTGPAVQRTTAQSPPPPSPLHSREEYTFAFDAQGEVQVLHQAPPHPGKYESSAETLQNSGENNSTNWYRVFAGLTVDSLERSLEHELLPLLQQNDVTPATLLSAIDKKTVLDRTQRLQAQHGLQSSEVDISSPLDDALFSADSILFSSEVSAEASCVAAASYYFPVTQYVAAQFGAWHSGTGPLEEVRLIVSGGPPEGQRGEEDILHQHTEAEAYDGNPYAQTWLAKKYFWGLGGIERNELAARRWFERAAAQNDPEGLYNVGIFHNNGQAGLPRNEELALQYFHRAADHPENPFPMALHAVGNHYMHSADKQNFTRAMEYFLKAAALQNDDAHFSLAMLYREGLGCPKDVPRSVAHLAVAASWGHSRALNFLAHALYDADSWLAQYGREQHALRRRQAMLSVLTSDRSSSVAATGEVKLAPLSTDEAHSNTTAFTDALLQGSQVFNEFELIKVFLPDGSIVPLPYPLGNPSGSCEAALPLLKYLAEMSYRPKDVTSRALKQYMKGDYWGALNLYEEAADLGVWAAQENAAFLLEKLIPTECAKFEEDDDQLRDTAGVVGQTLTNADHSESCHSAEECCAQYLRKLATHRWAQLAQAGEPRAMRRMADALLDPAASYLRSADAGALSKQQQAAVLFALAGEQGDTESLLHLGWMLYYGAEGLARNQSAAHDLFSEAMQMETDEYKLEYVAEEEQAVQTAPEPAAPETHEERLAAQEAAVRRHQHTRRWHAAGYASKTTGGAAPALALAIVRADQFLSDCGFNTTVKEINAAAKKWALEHAPESVTSWLDTADRPRRRPRSEGWLGAAVSLWARQLRDWGLWLEQLEHWDAELYNAVCETAALVGVVLFCAMLHRFFLRR